VKYTARVRVMPRTGLLDPQGQAIEHALASLGFERVSAVRVGRQMEIALEAESEQQVRERLAAMCERLLANPVTEDFAVDAVEVVR
jgi:phosphoribosylformylglycinamidine synthase